MSIDADPFLLYLGDIIGGEASAPVWQGPEGIQYAIDIGRYRVENNDWVRYRLFLHYTNNRNRISVARLDNDLQPIVSEFVEDVELNVSLATSFSIEWERRLGKERPSARRLKGIIGKGIGIATGRQHTERSISNPLEAYIGDTLWTESGYSASLSLYGYIGFQYSPIPELSLSARVNVGVFVDYSPSDEIRIVRSEGAFAELEQISTRGEGHSWGFGEYFRPRIMMSFYF